MLTDLLMMGSYRLQYVAIWTEQRHCNHSAVYVGQTCACLFAPVPAAFACILQICISWLWAAVPTSIAVVYKSEIIYMWGHNGPVLI